MTPSEKPKKEGDWKFSSKRGDSKKGWDPLRRGGLTWNLLFLVRIVHFSVLFYFQWENLLNLQCISYLKAILVWYLSVMQSKPSINFQSQKVNGTSIRIKEPHLQDSGNWECNIIDEYYPKNGNGESRRRVKVLANYNVNIISKF